MPTMNSRGLRWLLAILTAVIAVLLAAYPVMEFYVYPAWERHKYPYGWSHSCDKGLFFALVDYAQKHGGNFPAGEATPEASLSLLYHKGDWGVDAEILRGKTVPYDVVKQMLDEGKLLTPDTCGWHYVEGLRLGDDFRLALFWDKVGLGHNGERLSRGGYVVCLLSGPGVHIPASEWDDFLAEQQELHAARQAKAAPQPK